MISGPETFDKRSLCSSDIGSKESFREYGETRISFEVIGHGGGLCICFHEDSLKRNDQGLGSISQFLTPLYCLRRNGL